jgi:hypothetical protein
VIREHGAYAQNIDGPAVSGFRIGEKVTAKPHDTIDGAVAAAKAAIDTGNM